MSGSWFARLFGRISYRSSGGSVPSPDRAGELSIVTVRRFLPIRSTALVIPSRVASRKGENILAKIKDKISNIITVGELITALEKFPQDMPVESTLGDAIQVYRCEPTDGEYWDDPRGAIHIDSCDPYDHEDD